MSTGLRKGPGKDVRFGSGRLVSFLLSSVGLVGVTAFSDRSVYIERHVSERSRESERTKQRRTVEQVIGNVESTEAVDVANFVADIELEVTKDVSEIRKLCKRWV